MTTRSGTGCVYNIWAVHTWLLYLDVIRCTCAMGGRFEYWVDCVRCRFIPVYWSLVGCHEYLTAERRARVGLGSSPIIHYDTNKPTELVPNDSDTHGQPVSAHRPSGRTLGVCGGDLSTLSKWAGQLKSGVGEKKKA